MNSASKTITFVVESAAEAVERVRAELGSQGRVVSVRQVTGTGLRRFLAAPRLEIVARLDPPATSAAASVAAVAESAVVAADTAVQGSSPPSGAAAHQREVTPWEDGDAAAEIAGEMRGVRAGRVIGQQPQRPTERLCGDLLRQAGFPDRVMARLEGASEWREICQLPAASGLPRAVAWLRAQRGNISPAALPRRVAFIGGAGSGKTTSLCKWLAREVFRNQRRPEVLRMEVDKPHLDDGLSLYCEVLGLSCKVDPAEVDLESGEPVYVDFPGFSLQQKADQQRIAAALDAFGIDGRVLVLNAAYESAVLQQFLEVGHALGCKHQVLTHLDELMDVSKLWPHVLDPACRAWFFGNGQNIAGDMTTDVFGYLLERTFPR